MREANIWDRVLERLSAELDPDEYRRWFSATFYASDSGAQVTAWTPTESSRRHLHTHYEEAIRRAMSALGRPDTTIRFAVSGTDDDEELDS